VPLGLPVAGAGSAAVGRPVSRRARAQIPRAVSISASSRSVFELVRRGLELKSAYNTTRDDRGGAFDVTCSCQYYGCSIDLGPNYGGPPADSVVITGVSPEPPWQAGLTVNFAITGTGFGSSPTLNILWADGTSYNTSCSGSPCTGTTTVPSDAAGQAMATVSATHSGLGLFGGSSGQVGSGPYEIDVDAPTPTLTLQRQSIVQVLATGSPSGGNFTETITPSDGGSPPGLSPTVNNTQSTDTISLLDPQILRGRPRRGPSPRCR